MGWRPDGFVMGLMRDVALLVWWVWVMSANALVSIPAWQMWQGEELAIVPFVSGALALGLAPVLFPGAEPPATKAEPPTSLGIAGLELGEPDWRDWFD